MENTFEVSELAKYGLLDSAIKSRIMNELVNDNIEIKEPISKKLKEKLIKKLDLKNSTAKEMWLKKRNLKEEDLEYISQFNLKWRMFCKNKFKNNLKSIFLKRKDEFDTVIYSLLRVGNENFINKYMALHFWKLHLLRWSEKRTGGLIGPVPIIILTHF